MGGFAGSSPWQLKKVRWGAVFRNQTHGAWPLLIVAAILGGVSHLTNEPDVRTVKLYDATVAMPMKPNTVSIFTAGALPAAALIVTIAAVEFGVMYRRQSLTHAIHAFCHLVWMSIIGFAVVLAVTEATKPVASRLRPDFMSRCNPVVSPGTNTTVGFNVDVTCNSQLPEEEQEDGRLSFPSGHSSNSMSLCWYTLLYFSHALYWREGFSYMGGLWKRPGVGSRLLMELLQGLFLIWGCCVLGISWWIGVTRYTDHRHNIDDIVGGFVVALLWMTPVAIIALGQLRFYQRRLSAELGEPLPTDDDAELGLLLTPAGAAAAAGTATAVAGSKVAGAAAAGAPPAANGGGAPAGAAAAVPALADGA